MTSAVLVLKYMPDMCINCLLSGYSNQGRPFCKAKNLYLDSFMYKPDWCPLVELPKYQVRDYPEYDRYITGYDDGWDACINEIILGEDYE
jgi:hypothetical protein